MQPFSPPLFPSLLDTQPISPPPQSHKRLDSQESLHDVHLEELNRWRPQRRPSSQSSVVEVEHPARPAKPVAAARSPRPNLRGGNHETQDLGGDGNTSVPPSAIDERTATAQSASQEALRADGPSERDWDRGIFDCFELDTAQLLETICCACVTFSEIKWREIHPEDGELKNFERWCNGTCWGHCCLAYATCGLGQLVWQAFNRNELREKLGIRGSGLEDCITAYLLGPCQLCQEVHQVKHDRHVLIEKKISEMAANYSTQPQMSYSRA